MTAKRMSVDARASFGGCGTQATMKASVTFTSLKNNPMRKLLLSLLLLLFIGLQGLSGQHLKKDGTPDRRYTIWN